MPKLSILGQIACEIFVQLCSNDPIKILLNLTRFKTIRTASNLERFVWSHQRNKVLVSRSQFHFHNKGFALCLVLKVRVFETRKWPIQFLKNMAKFRDKLKDRLTKLKRCHHFKETLSLPSPHCILHSLLS